MAYVIAKGGNINFLIDDTAIECETQSDVSFSTDEIDTTCKNSANNKSFQPGAKQTEFTIGGNYTEGTGSNEDFRTLYTKYAADTSFTGKWGGVDTGDYTYSGTCYIMSLSATAGNSGSLVTWSATVKVSGAVTAGAVA